MKCRGSSSGEGSDWHESLSLREFFHPALLPLNYALSGNNMEKLRRYLANLTAGRIILWCYAIWYLVNVLNHFDARPRFWLTSAGLSAIIGTALFISTRSSSRGTTQLDGWQVFRLFLMPFCVSSFAALVKDAAYVLIFPPTLKENLLGLGMIAVFVGIVMILKMSPTAKAANVPVKTAAQSQK